MAWKAWKHNQMSCQWCVYFCVDVLQTEAIRSLSQNRSINSEQETGDVHYCSVVSADLDLSGVTPSWGGAGSSSAARSGYGTRYQKASSLVSAITRRLSVTPLGLFVFKWKTFFWCQISCSPKSPMTFQNLSLWAFDIFLARKLSFAPHHSKQMIFSPYESCLLSIRGHFRHQTRRTRALLTFKIASEPCFDLIFQCFCRVSEPADMLHSFMSAFRSPLQHHNTLPALWTATIRSLFPQCNTPSFWPFLFSIRLTKEVQITSDYWGHRPLDAH